MKRLVSLLLILVLTLTFCFPILATEDTRPTQAITAFEISDYNLVWESPSRLERDNMPAGGYNGLAVMAWTPTPTQLQFYIGQVGAYRQDGSTMKLGKVILDFSEAVFDENETYLQTLNLANGKLEFDTTSNKGVRLQLALWVDANSSTIRMAGVTSQPVAVTVSYDLSYNQSERPIIVSEALVEAAPEFTHGGKDYVIDTEANELLWYHRTRSTVWTNAARAQGATDLTKDPFDKRTFGGILEGAGLTRDPADAKKLVGAAATTLDMEIHVLSEQFGAVADWETTLRAQQAADHKCDTAKADREHTAWWAAYWDRSYIEITQIDNQKEMAFMLTQNYALLRYLNACQQRNAMVTKFDGSIFNVDYGQGNADHTRWEGLTIMWQNTRWPYTTMLAAGDYDFFQTLINEVYGSLENAMARVKKNLWY